MDGSRIKIRGPLTSQVEGLWETLTRQGYSRLSIANIARVMAHLSRWLSARGLAPADLTIDQIHRFLRHRRRAGYTCWRSARGLEPILVYLRSVGLVPPAVDAPVIATPRDEVLARYRRYLREERALTPSTTAFYEHVARTVLPSDGTLGSLTPSAVTDFVRRQARTSSVAYTKYTGSALRCLLRYLYVQGDLTTDLAAAVPAVAGWRLTSLPRDLPAADLAHLLRACDRRTREGRRALAALLLMARLGLRAGEVAALRLDDVRWTDAEMRIRGKGGRVDSLPVPADVGAAVAGYVRWSRPRTDSRALFVRGRAPHRGLSSGGVTSLVRAACRRAGLPAIGAHRLRHTAATQMLRHGASLHAIAQVLRHRHVDTTAIYAKVDREALRTLAQPWPGGLR